jgi:hypothetical protein
MKKLPFDSGRKEFKRLSNPSPQIDNRYKEKTSTESISDALGRFKVDHEYLRNSDLLNNLEEAFEKVPMPAEGLNNRTAEVWLMDCQDSGIFEATEYTAYLDVLLGVLDYKRSSSTEIGVADKEVPGETAYGKTLRTGLDKMKKDWPLIDSDGMVDKLIRLLEEHPFTYDGSYEVERWLTDLLERKAIQGDEYNALLDILSSDLI